MSQTETHIGKIRKVDLCGKSAEEFCKECLSKSGVTELSSYNESWIDEFQERGYKKYVFISKADEIYELIEHDEIGEDFDIFKREANGDITFVTRFYNGGTCLSERIEDSVSRMPAIEEKADTKGTTMTNKINDGGAAFPRSIGDTTIKSPLGRAQGIYNTSQDGMTLRAYLAAKALQGILASPDKHGKFKGCTREFMRKELVKEAVLYADALITELREEQP